MRVKMLWYGGYSYATPDNDGAESFPSLRAAIEECESRYHNRDGRTPCVEYDYSDGPATCAWIFFGEVGDYPDRLVVRTERGAYRAERC